MRYVNEQVDKPYLKAVEDVSKVPIFASDGSFLPAVSAASISGVSESIPGFNIPLRIKYMKNDEMQDWLAAHMAVHLAVSHCLIIPLNDTAVNLLIEKVVPMVHSTDNETRKVFFFF
jgi:hypothetical protein